MFDRSTTLLTAVDFSVHAWATLVKSYEEARQDFGTFSSLCLALLSILPEDRGLSYLYSVSCACDASAVLSVIAALAYQPGSDVHDQAIPYEHATAIRDGLDYFFSSAFEHPLKEGENLVGDYDFDVSENVCARIFPMRRGPDMPSVAVGSTIGMIPFRASIMVWKLHVIKMFVQIVLITLLMENGKCNWVHVRELGCELVGKLDDIMEWQHDEDLYLHELSRDQHQLVYSLWVSFFMAFAGAGRGPHCPCLSECEHCSDSIYCKYVAGDR